MGRLKNLQNGGSIFTVKYQKLVDEYGSKDYLRIVPKVPDYLSYSCCQCGHSQRFKAEELNTIVGNAFRMAYAAQLQKKPTFNEVIASQLEQQSSNIHPEPEATKNTKNGDEVKGLTKSRVWAKQIAGNVQHKEPLLAKSADMNALSSPPFRQNGAITSDTSQDTSAHVQVVENRHHMTSGTANGNIENPVRFCQNSLVPMSPLKPQKPNIIPGLMNKMNSSDPNNEQLTPSSEESNSPTELNSYKRLVDKPPLIKRLTMDFNNEEDMCPLVNNSSAREGINRPLSGGYVNEGADSNTESRVKDTSQVDNRVLEAKDIELENKRLSQTSPSSEEFKSKRISQISSCSSSSSYPLPPIEGSTHSSTPPPLPERTDSLTNPTEENALRAAPWFQAGIPREIALEILSHEPIGAFMVRESTSKPGCYALSLRVSRDFQPSGIAHYLIMRTNKGYKIKGFTKEFITLTALITHHSVMPELLPCPLSLSRYNPSFCKSDSSKDFADIDSDPDYNTLSDFRKMMADLNV